MDALRAKKAFICDMDGVIYHGNRLLPGITKFLDWLRKEHKKFLFLANSSERSPRELGEKMRRLTVEISEEHFHTILSDNLRSLNLSHFRMNFEEPAFSLLTADQN